MPSTSPTPPDQRYQAKLFTGSSHTWALDHLKNLPRTATILDIGAGSGIIAQALRSEGFSSICGVEIDEGARRAVAPHYLKIEADLAPFRGERFDAVLLLDVVEHVADPAAFFELAASHVAPGGILLLSVPNVAHWSVRIPLLFGFFEYTERGILDRTHLSFFSRRRFRRFVQSTSQLAAAELSASIPPFEFILPKPIWDNEVYRALTKGHLACARALPGFFAYQHLALLKKSPNR